MARQESTGDLFPPPELPTRVGKIPLAERMRPRRFDDLVGQDDVVGPGRPLRKAIEQDELSSVIFWGPPGCGKTTLAGLVAEHTASQFVPFSAVTGGIPELRELIKAAEHRRSLGRATTLFVDEIHRFNKAQQDAFLPHVERGTVVLIGATTENPSFELIAPLLSRSLVVILKPLTEDALGLILDRALADRERGLGSLRIDLHPAARHRLIAFGNGDARSLLTALEFVAGQAVTRSDGSRTIDEETLDAALLKKSLRYDKSGEEHYNLISAYIKSLRDSDLHDCPAPFLVILRRSRPIVSLLLKRLGEVTLFSPSRRIIVNVAISSAVADLFHERGDRIPEMQRHPEIALLLGILKGLSQPDIGGVVFRPRRQIGCPLREVDLRFRQPH